MKIVNMRIVICSVIFLICASAMAYDNDCIERASAKYHVPAIVIKAIIEMESGGNPLAVNIEGKPYFPQSQLEAENLINRNRGRSTDVGLMQVNSFWFKKLNAPQYLGFSECFNINFGTWILAYEIQNHGLNLNAVGRYHSPDMSKGRPYASEVLRKMIRILNRG